MKLKRGIQIILENQEQN